MATPNDVAAILNQQIDPRRSPQRYAAQQDARLAESVRGNYANTSQALADQLAQSKNRYEAATGDIKSIFGTLANVRAQDEARIRQQYTNSVAAAQQQLAQRTAQAQQQLAAGQKGAATAGAELGAGPAQMPTDSLTSQAVAEGIADSNALQTVWGNLMGAMSNQQQTDVKNAVQGYNYQQAAALDELRRAYEDRTMGLQGQQASLEDQISQQIAGAKAQQAQNEYDWNVKQADMANKLALQQIRWGNRGAGNAQPAEKKYGKDLAGFQQKIADVGADYGYITSSATDAYNAIASKMQGKKPNASDVYRQWTATMTGKEPNKKSSPQTWEQWNANRKQVDLYAPYVLEYLNYIY